MRKSLLLYQFIFIVFLLSACSEDELIDTNAPEINLERPGNHGYLIAGEFVDFKATFTDDRELATYNVEIHDNFDSHAHGRIAGVSDDPSLIKWSYNQNFLIPGGNTEFLVETDDVILVPENTLAGPYHFIVRAIDQAGNSTGYQDGTTAEHEVYISNDDQPVVNITNLVDDELEIEAGVLFSITGEISDPTIGEYAGMHGVDITLGEDEHDDHGHDHGRIAAEDLIDMSIEESELDQFMTDDIISLDKVFEDINFTLSENQLSDLVTEEIDHLILIIRVHDEQGNISISRTPVHIHAD